MQLLCRHPCETFPLGTFHFHSCRENTRFRLLCDCDSDSESESEEEDEEEEVENTGAAAEQQHQEEEGQERRQRAGRRGRGTQGAFVAVSPIAPGDTITTCYLGYDEFRLMSARWRRWVRGWLRARFWGLGALPPASQEADSRRPWRCRPWPTHLTTLCRSSFHMPLPHAPDLAPPRPHCPPLSPHPPRAKEPPTDPPAFKDC